MGRHIYGNEVGSSAGDAWVHKFWFGVQNSDVSPYLEMEEQTRYTALLQVGDRERIAKIVADSKRKFAKKFGRTYKSWVAFIEKEQKFHEAGTKEYEMDQWASHINLGEHLLQTIDNMKKQGVDDQYLDIEV